MKRQVISSISANILKYRQSFDSLTSCPTRTETLDKNNLPRRITQGFFQGLKERLLMSFGLSGIQLLK